MRILIVEDEGPIAEGLKFNFEQEGYEVTAVGDGTAALDVARDSEPPLDLVVLDLMLPGMSGYEICKEIRRTDTQVPIMVLSARLHSQDKAHAFDCGADQYVTKPFDLNEVLSRVRNLLKRRHSETRPSSLAGEDVPNVYEFNGIVVDCQKFEVAIAGESKSLTTMEMQLLRYFIEHEGIVLSRARILADVWGQSPDITTRSIDNFVMRLRKLIEPTPSSPLHFISVRGTGYRFVADITDSKP